MAQRDEGLDKLEAFIAGAAETRAVLQRETEALADAEDEMDELGERLDQEMKDLGTTAREFDARYGPVYEILMASFMGASLPLTYSAGYSLGFQLARMNRPLLIVAAEALEHAYERFPENRKQALEELARADAAAADAFDELRGELRALGMRAAPLAEGVAVDLGGLRAQLDAHLEVGS